MAQLDTEPVIVLDGEKIVAMITSPEAAEHERRAGWRRFLLTRDRVAAELEVNLAKDGLSVEEFLADVLSEQP